MCEQLQAGVKFVTNMASRDVKRIKEYIQKIEFGLFNWVDDVNWPI